MMLALLDHLWQSTLCVGVAVVLSVLLRRHGARLRYLVWLAASVKFLVPFSALTTLGAALRPGTWHGLKFAAAPGVSEAIAIVQPDFAASALRVSTGANVTQVLLAVWAVGAVALFLRWIGQWWRVRAVAAAAQPVSLGFPIEARLCADVAAPCVLGTFAPVLLLPPTAVARMRPEELAAVCAHELCHVRWHDNLAAAVHLVVAGLFWFYPPVWWIGKRLLQERERACDEAVIAGGASPRVYARGILSACRLAVESRLELLAGAAGADLKSRIEVILANAPRKRLGRLGELSLSMIGGALLAMPLSAGIAASRPFVSPALLNAVRFDSAAIAPTTRVGLRAGRHLVSRPGMLSVRNISLRSLVGLAYAVPERQVLGGPEWIDAHYDIEASATLPIIADDADAARMQSRMILALIGEHFGLKVVEFAQKTSD